MVGLLQQNTRTLYVAVLNLLMVLNQARVCRTAFTPNDSSKMVQKLHPFVTEHSVYTLLLSILFLSCRATIATDQSESTSLRKLPPTLSRHPSVTVNYADHGTQMEDDTFEHILQETAHHDTVMAFYYMDENNKVPSFWKITEGKG
jgi:hypothetical protein